MRRMIVIVLGLLVVLVALDYGARMAAEAAVARRIQTTENLPQQPDVRMTGFPFLTQALRGNYQQVDVRMAEVPAGGELRLDVLDATLDGVHLPLGAVLQSGARSVPVDHVHVAGTATYAALDAQLATVIPAQTATVHFSDGGAGQLRVTATYRGLAVPVTVSALAAVSVHRNRLTVRVPAQALTEVPANLRTTVSQLLTQTVQLQRLPLGLVANGVSVGPAGVTATADASDVTLGTS